MAAEREAPESRSLTTDVAALPMGSNRSKRTRGGCLNCRRRHKKCDERRPQCCNCTTRGDSCEWQVKVLFKSDNNLTLVSGHPSMNHGTKRPRHYEIRDITSEVVRDYQTDMLAADADERLRRVRQISDTRDSDSSGLITTNTERPPDHASYQQSIAVSESPLNSTAQSLPPRSNSSYTSSHRADDDTHTFISKATAPFRYASSPLQTEVAANDLLALRYMPFEASMPTRYRTPQSQLCAESSSQSSHRTSVEPTQDRPASSFSDEDLFTDGSAYHELHRELRKHIIAVTTSATSQHSTQPSRLDSNLGGNTAVHEHQRNFDALGSSVRPGTPFEDSGDSELPPYREYALWKNWLDNVAPALDKFDCQRHFEQKLPVIAKSSPALKYSMLALSAHQIDRQSHKATSPESLMLYRKAVHLIIPVLHTKTSAVIASCIVLCTLEMLCGKPREWRRHIEAYARFIVAVGINGFVGGINQALFWCFARLDTYAALICEEATLLPIEHWAPGLDWYDNNFPWPSEPSFDKYANRTLFLCAAVLHLMTSGDKSGYFGTSKAAGFSGVLRLANTAESSHLEMITRKWQVLYDLLDDWYVQRPEEMKAILVIPVTTKGHQSPFPTILFGTGGAASGNQLYHTATLLLLQHKPRNIHIRKNSRSSIWHARQVCAIAESNIHHSQWTSSSVHPLWIAGQVLSHPGEHSVILRIFDMIEKTTGWATRWRADELREHWGDVED